MQKITKAFIKFGFTTFFAFCLMSSVYACSCLEKKTVDKEFESTPNVAVFRLIEFTDRFVDRVSEFKIPKFKVIKVLKGDFKIGQEIVAGRYFNDCAMNFSKEEIDTEFLFYLPEKAGHFSGELPDDDSWYPSNCSRSATLKYAAADLLYLENTEKLQGKTRLSGRVEKYVAGDQVNEKAGSYLLASKRIIVKGNGKKYEVFTDKNGVFEIYDLPPGKYKLSTDKIKGYSFTDSERKNWVEVDIKPKSHTEVFIYFQSTDSTPDDKDKDAKKN